MTITYPAVFRQKEDGSYDGYFPDLTGCRFEGKTLDDARNDAIEAGAFPDLPFVSHHEDIATGDHEFVQDISVIIHLGVGYY